jgi:hydrogenase maturation protease
MKTLVIGLGNPILGDDGLGWAVVQEVARRTAADPEVEVDCLSLGGLSLMERLTGYEHVILVDSLYTGRTPAGTISQFSLLELPDLSAGHTASAHDTSLHNALNVGRSMNIPLPGDDAIQVVAVEAQAVFDFSEKLSSAVEAAVPQAAALVLELLRHNKE